MAQVSRTKVWTDGLILFSADLNAEFNNLLSNLQLVNADIASNAQIATSKINATFPSSAIVGISDSQIITNKDLSSGTNTLPATLVTASSTNTFTNKTTVQRVATYTPGGAGTTTLDLSTGGIQSVTMPAATQTLAISNATVGQCFIVEINNVTSQGALTWFTTIKWVSGTTPTLTGTNGKKDTFGFRVTGAGTYDGYIVGQNI